MRLLIAFLIAVTAVSAYDVSEESSFELPADWSSIRSSIDTSFSCVGRAYGYYADVANDCQLYHVCQPRIENDVTVYRHDPFICPLTTVFDQRSLSCVHSTPEFSCVDSVQYYADTENHYAHVAPINENVSYEPAPVVDVVNSVPAFVDAVPEVPVARVVPVVSEAPVVVSEVPVVPVASVKPAVVDVLDAEVPVARSTNVENPVVSNESSSEVAAEAPVLNSTSSLPVVRSNEFYIQRESAEVNHVLPSHHVVNPLPVASRMMQQSQQTLVMEPVRKGYSPVKRNVYRPIQQQLVEQPVKAPVKAPLQQQLVQVPVKAPIQHPVKAPIQQQLVQVPVKAPVHHPVKAPIQQQLVEQPVKAPVKAPLQQQLVQVPVKAPVHHPVKAPLQQQLVQVPVKAPVHHPVKAPIQQQLVEQPVKAPVKSVVRQTQQLVELPRKSNGPVRQENMMRSTYVPHTYYYNGVPSWRHHYYRLRPHLVSTRWV